MTFEVSTIRAIENWDLNLEEESGVVSAAEREREREREAVGALVQKKKYFQMQRVIIYINFVFGIRINKMEFFFGINKIR